MNEYKRRMEEWRRTLKRYRETGGESPFPTAPTYPPPHREIVAPVPLDPALRTLQTFYLDYRFNCDRWRNKANSSIRGICSSWWSMLRCRTTMSPNRIY